MAVVPEPGACKTYELLSQRACGAITAAQPAGAEPTCNPTRLSSPKKRSRQCERREQGMLPTAPGLWRGPGSGGGGRSGGGGGGGGGIGGRAEWRMCNNKENIDPRTGRPSQHPFPPFSPPFSASLLACGPAIAATTTALSAAPAAASTAAGGTSGRTSSIQKRLFCGSGCGEGGGQVRLRPAAAISRKPFGEPPRELWNSRSSRCSG